MITRHLAPLFLLAAAPVFADMSDTLVFTTDRLERHFDHEDYALEFDLEYGNDVRKYVLRFEGVKPDGHDLDGELQLLYAKPVSAFFDVQFGLEAALHEGSTTGGIVAGIVGEAPYRMEIEARATFNEDGDLFIHAELERDFLLTEKLVLQPRLGIRAGDGDESLATELRARYEISRKFAPYVGISWEKIYGDLDDEGTTVLAGVFFWF